MKEKVKDTIRIGKNDVPLKGQDGLENKLYTIFRGSGEVTSGVACDFFTKVVDLLKSLEVKK